MDKCVGIMFQNEEDWLRLHLPHLTKSDSWDLIMLDGGSTDFSNEVAVDNGALIGYRKFDYDWSAQSNALLDFARRHQYKKMVRLDPDELMFIDDIRKLFVMLEMFSACAYPTYHFEVDRNHWCEELWPDYHIRAFNLDSVHYAGKVHEGPTITGDIYWTDQIALYHYEGLKPLRYRMLKGINYRRIAQGLEPLSELPEEYAAVNAEPRKRVPFMGKQPVEFKNIRAPYGD